MSRGGSRGRSRAAWFSVREKRLSHRLGIEGVMRLGGIKGIPNSKWKAGVRLHRMQETVNGMNPGGSPDLKTKIVGFLR